MNRIRVSKRVEKKLAKGLVLLEASDLENVNLKDQEVEVQSQEGTFLGTAYLSQQNKGLGWFVSTDKVTFNQAFFETLFRQAKEKRKSYYQDDLTTAFRLFNQEGDGFGGLTVDLYGDYAVFSWYNSYVYQIRKTISEAFKQVFPEVLGAYEKIRFKGLDYESAHVYGQEAPDFFTVLENGVLYQVFMNDGLMTGIFLDQHEVRGSLVDGLAMGKSLLNMFSYTAAFSVAATMGGASQTTSVDLAKRSRELSQAHFQANGISTDDHRFVVMDVFEYFKYAKRKGLTYDVIVLDPPSFARNKKQTFSVAKDYHKLISQSLEILNPGGIIIASTNAANVSRQKFTEQIDKGFAGRSYQILNKYGLPADFAYNKKDESSNYLKVISMKVSK
ncbi:class I SAM-dependent rRNA methyltransferase [Streptococcus pseudopneumoniae]|uniref:class I SAM-dependent rRNA methyltransferase n=1 Tax=Streptococcus pseudopneumoniae TaxID=257758 RepID=UPI00025B5AF3|nr:class I SAM-dependent rRNA methyltransferase [Streptococcus pseudopneumoniae]HEX0197235.1 class I SAM-dependent rRNA methyltransferase [Streptococcus pneumoniae]EID71086.1 S-adenosylmethionine-dependent methyltransferase [Streptococcus pseudopneumoniae SK674]MBF9606146.1 class I SAM-dependent rRNA methyltransferase [Streptococcus pseudopneumoniae]MBF9638262.1 class I SAM-dependent rRNA methyltransferase [Streptococcus pseudopneumoniae]MBF9640332.1 class I SAM-dependent rRNA methyltransferas